MELVNELRRNPHPDVIHAIHVLHDTGVSFSPLLQCIINEIVEDPTEVRVEDVEANPREIPMGFEMHQSGDVGLPALNPAVSVLLDGDRGREAVVNELASSLFSLLEEQKIVCVLDAFVKCLVCVAIGNRVIRFYSERDVNQLIS